MAPTAMAKDGERILQAGEPARHNQGRAPKAQISTSYDIHSKTYYLVKYADAGSDARYYLKHYNDFVALCKALQKFMDEQPWNETPISILPQLPEAGRFGLRRSLSTIGMGNFAKKLQEELDGWLQVILAQIPTLSKVPALEDFFGRDPLSPSMSEACRTKLENLHAILRPEASATEVAAGAAKQGKEAKRKDTNEESSERATATLLRRCQTKQIAVALEFESAGLEKEQGKDEDEAVPVPSQRRRQLRTQQTVAALALESAGLETADDKREAEEERIQRVYGPSSRRRELRTQGTAGALAFESAGF